MYDEFYVASLICYIIMVLGDSPTLLPRNTCAIDVGTNCSKTALISSKPVTLHFAQVAKLALRANLNDWTFWLKYGFIVSFSITQHIFLVLTNLHPCCYPDENGRSIFQDAAWCFKQRRDVNKFIWNIHLCGCDTVDICRELKP